MEDVTTKNEFEACVIAYDLPSENRIVIRDKQVYNKIRTTRILSTYKLHSLGILTTESVILVPKSKLNEVQNAIDTVYKLYNDLNIELEKKYNLSVGEPLIKVIPITRKQHEDFKALAQRKIKERLDKLINKLTELLNEIDEIIESEKIRRIKNNIRKQKREIQRIEQYCKELGIDTNHKFELISELFQEVFNTLEGESL
ncbi:MAG: hypothetical protein NDF55_10600 [archaeon GB-1867-005]|nr:hypothetical protein [Candidatus Culexmicrobium cathedralense]